MLRDLATPILLLWLGMYPVFLLRAKNPPSVKEVTSNIVCTCGCTMIVSSCTCSSADSIRAQVGTLIGQGLSKKQIWDRFAAKYGQAVLASPPVTGFDLTVWIMPFAAVIVVGGLLAAALRRWVASSRPPATARVQPDSPEREALLETLRRELRKFDR